MGGDVSASGWIARMLRGVLVSVVGLGIALRWQHVLNSDFLLTGDDGVVVLMGLHILKGEGFPLMFYGQHYMGTLDAMVAALFFGWLGISAESYKVSVLLYAGLTLTLVGWTTHRLWGPARACLAAGLLAFAPAAIRWQMDQPNYGILFLFAAILMAMTGPLLSAPQSQAAAGRPALLCGWAFLAGLGVWMHSLILSLVLPVPVLLWLRRALPGGGRLAAMVGCFLLGTTPLLLHNVTYPLATFRQFAGFFLDITSRSQVEDLSPVQIVLRGLWHKVDPTTVGLNLLVAVGGYDLRDYPVLLGSSYPTVLAFLALFVGAAAVCVREGRRLGWRAWVASPEGSTLAWLLLSVALVILLGSTRSRYMALLVPLLALLLAGRWGEGFWSRPVEQVLLGSLCLYLAAASLVLNVTKPLALPNPVPGLARFLESKGLTLGYTGFELAYPLVLQTREAVRVSPLAGPLVDNQYPPYTWAVEATPAPFYIYAEQEPLGEVLADYLRRQGIGFEESRVEGHRVFWGLSRAVRPDQFLPEPYLAAYKRAHA